MVAKALEFLGKIPVARKAVEFIRRPGAGSDIAALVVAGILAAYVVALGLGPLGEGYNTDGWFILAAGREILENGIPHENVWSWEPGLSVVVQQWAHDAWMQAWNGVLGFQGVGAACAIEAAALVACLWLLLPSFRSDGAPSAPARGFAVLACLLAAMSYINVRPTMWSMMCLLATLAVCNGARKDARRYWALPAITLVHVNLQAAMWALDAFAAACFLLPWDAAEARALAERGGLARFAKSRLPLLAAICGMAAASLANPYGVQGSLYTALSMGEASYKGLIQEMGPLLAAMGADGAAFMLAIALGPVVWQMAARRRVPPLPAAALLLASLVEALMHARSLWILGIAAMACALSMAPRAGSGRIAGGGPVLVAACAALVAACGFGMAHSPAFDGARAAEGGSGVDSRQVMSWETGESGIGPLAAEISDSGIPNPKVYASSDVAWAVLEYYGVPVLCDLRPEIWGERISGAQGYSPWRDYCDSLESEAAQAAYLEREGFDFFLLADVSSGDFKERHGLAEVASSEGWTLLRADEAR